MTNNLLSKKWELVGGCIREINPLSEYEIDLVARRMRQTLVEVVGQERGATMYSMDWLEDRILWHLDSKNTIAKVFLAESADAHIAGHAIARIESSANGERYGYFSTLFVESESRKMGIATALMFQVETWFSANLIAKIIYNTATDNTRVLNLFHKYGYHITTAESEMVQLTKLL